MNGPAELVIEVRQGETVVHRFVRATAQPTSGNVAKMIGQGLGWMQAYQGALNEQQWRNDVVKAAVAQALAEEPEDGTPPGSLRSHAA